MEYVAGGVCRVKYMPRLPSSPLNSMDFSFTRTSHHSTHRTRDFAATGARTRVNLAPQCDVLQSLHSASIMHLPTFSSFTISAFTKVVRAPLTSRSSIR